MNNVCLIGKLETEPQIVTKGGKGQFFYFKLRVMNMNENGYDKINCAIYDQLCVDFYSRCKVNDLISITGQLVPSNYLAKGIIVHSYNVVVNKFELIASSEVNYKPKSKIKDEYLEG